MARRAWSALVFALLVAAALLATTAHARIVDEDDEENSDVEFEVPRARVRSPPRRVVADPVQPDDTPVEDNELSDDLGEVPAEVARDAADGAADDGAPKSRPMTQRWRQQKTFMVELGFLTLIIWGVVTYFIGKTDNAQISQTWLTHFLKVLDKQFTLIGDDGNFGERPKQPVVLRDNPASLNLYCSGRKHCVSCLFKFDLLSRHDLLAKVYNFFAKSKDELVITAELGDGDMQSPFVFAVVPTRGHKEYKEAHPDMKSCAVVKAAGYKGLPKQFVAMVDADGAAAEILSEAVRETITANAKWFHSIHITDNSPFIDTRKKKVIRCRLLIPPRDQMGEIETLIKMALHLIDRVATVRLSDKELKLVKQIREAASIEQRRAEQQQKQEEVARKKLEAKKKEQEERDQRLESLPPEVQKKLEAKRHKQEIKKKTSGKSKVKFFAM